MSDENGMTIGGALSWPALCRWALPLFTSPRGFFRSMEKSGGYGTPALYAAFWILVSSALGFLVSLFHAAGPLGRLAQVMGMFLSPLMGLAFGAVAAAVLFVIWHLMGSKRDYQTAFRVWAFLAPLGAVGALLGPIPFLNLAVLLYGFYMLVLASQEVHGLPAERSWAVWGSLGGVMAVFLFFAVLAGMMFRGNRGALNFPPAAASFPGGR